MLRLTQYSVPPRTRYKPKKGYADVEKLTIEMFYIFLQYRVRFFNYRTRR